jgi:hypothetical protein
VSYVIFLLKRCQNSFKLVLVVLVHEMGCIGLVPLDIHLNPPTLLTQNSNFILLTCK